MAFSWKALNKVTVLILLAAFVVSCGSPRKPAEPERPPVYLPPAETSEAEDGGEGPGAGVSAQALPPVEAPALTQALVTFLSGEATHSAGGGEWQEVEIGLSLERNETLKVGEDSYCELQFGDVGALRVQAGTQVLLKDVFLKPDESRIGVQLAVGSVLAKVSKLSGDERFQVRTSTAVCGVRGTQFGVTVSDAGDTRLAVKEGRVAVLPTAVDLAEVTGKVQNEQVVLAVARIEQSAPVVAADQEMVIGQDTMKQAEEVFRAVERQVEEIVRLEQSGAAAATSEQDLLLNELDSRAERTVQRVAAVMAPAQAISRESSEELAPIEQMRLVEIPAPALEEAPAAAGSSAAATSGAEAAAPGGPTPAARPVARLEKVGFTVQPADAQILVNGTPVGRGSFSGLYGQGESLRVVFRREGYAERELVVEVERGGSRQYAVTLKEEIVPVEVSFRTSPEDARILVDGKEAGAGRFTGTWPSGTRLAVRAEKETWLPRELTVEVRRGGESSFDLVLERQRQAVTVKAVPADAAIRLAGRAAGTGTYTAEHPIGEKLAFQVVRAGYVPRTLAVEVAAGTENRFEVRLEREQREILIRANPPDAVIARGGQALARGVWSGRFAVGEALSFQVSRDGYVARILNLTVPDENRRTFTVDLTEEAREITVRAQPADAEILLDGQKLGQGGLTRSFPLGRALIFTVRRPGYQDGSLTVPAGRTQGGPYLVTLKGLPVQWRRSVFEGAVVRGLAAGPEGAVGADDRGNLAAVGRGGEPQWNVATRNRPNDNSMPVRIGNNVYFSGAEELLIVNAANGSVITRLALEPAFSHLFGRRVVPFGQSAVFPADNVLRLINLYSGETLREIAVPEGTRMTPTPWGGRLLVVNQQGVFLVIDPQSGAVEAQVPTAAAQPVALAVAVHGDRAFFADRKGLVVAVDLAERRVAWEASLPRGPEASMGVFQDLAAGPHGVFVWARGALHGFSLEGGAPLFPPVAGVSGPPLYRPEEGLLYYGTGDGALVIADTAGKARRRLELKAVITAQPAWVDGLLLLGTRDGEMIQVNPAFIE